MNIVNASFLSAIVPKCLKSSRIGPCTAIEETQLKQPADEQLPTSVKHLICGQTPGKKIAVGQLD
jgi:hypothetical protein